MDNTSKYIMGNTTPLTIEEIVNSHIILTHAKDNSALISQYDFIKVAEEVIKSKYNEVSLPYIYASHKVRGRIPEARFKSSFELLPHEETIYYDRLIYLFKVREIRKNINGNTLSLVIGGVKCYSHDNLNGDSKSPQNFKFFMGFQVKVCNNLCIWTDESIIDIKCNNLGTLHNEIANVVGNFDSQYQLTSMDTLDDYEISESQLALIIGRIKMYNLLPIDERGNLSKYDLLDTQSTTVLKNYYNDPVFGKRGKYTNLWQLYNLFTESSKTSYIDKFTNRNLSSGKLMIELQQHLNGERESYFLR